MIYPGIKDADMGSATLAHGAAYFNAREGGD
jgi:hypothetical protein